MKRSERESVNRVSANVVRSTNEPEDIDLAAEATASAPAKSLELEKRAKRRTRTAPPVKSKGT